jgi:uncharacterized protein with FMN-binding domain
MTKKLLVVLAVAAVLSLGLSACFVEYDPDDLPQGEPFGTSSGTAKGTAQGYGGSIEVTLTLANGYIDTIEISGPGETPAIGGLLIKNAPESIKKANSFDAISSASAVFTRDGIIKAGNQALSEITGGAFGSK